MSEALKIAPTRHQACAADQAAIYQITLGDRLGAEWSSWFDELAITTNAQNQTVLIGLIADQAALHGLLAKIRDLGLTLVAVARSEQCYE